MPHVKNILTEDTHDGRGRNDAGGFDFHNIENAATVPEDNSHRCLILAFDGTGNQFDDDVSCVLEEGGVLLQGIRREGRYHPILIHHHRTPTS